MIDALGELGFGEPGLGIRWPNDLECGGRKLGGVLPELVETLDGNRLLIGVGLNVQTNFEAAPEEVRAMATSLAAVCSRAIESELPTRLLAAIFSAFRVDCGATCGGRFAACSPVERPGPAAR